MPAASSLCSSTKGCFFSPLHRDDQLNSVSCCSYITHATERLPPSSFFVGLDYTLVAASRPVKSAEKGAVFPQPVTFNIMLQ